jgi:dihydrofolate synthase / folylpolyglutamate synthase
LVPACPFHHLEVPVSRTDEQEQIAAAFARANERLTARGPGRMVPDLDRITALSRLLGDPQRAYPSIHLTGTNGKGSTTRMLGSLCAAAGIAAGTYTSPHVQTVRERLAIAGQLISARRFAEVHDEVAALADLLDAEARERDGEAADHVTYFELLTAMAGWWFAETPVDVGIFEVGMGGRWDATNLVRGDVAVLTPIDLDHRELGTTPEQIAREKVGIIKPGSHVVSAAQHAGVAAVIEDAVSEQQATLWVAGTHFAVESRAVAVGGQSVTLRVEERELGDVLLPLFGPHQADNAALALAAFAAFTGDSFGRMDDEVLRHGLEAVTMPGRLEIVQREPTVLLDGAHNPHGARATSGAIAEAFAFGELVLVAGCMADKDIEAILDAFRASVSHVIVTRPPTPRAASLDRMRSAALAVWGDTGVVVEAAADVATALELATAVAGPGDGVLVTGSLHTVGAARERYLPSTEHLEDEVVVTPETAVEDDDVDLLTWPE